MTATQLLEDLHQRGVTLRAVGDRLRYRPRDAVSPEVKVLLIQHKHDLLALLQELGAALAQLEAEVSSGQIGSGPILVRGKPLADWLSLDELAWWLRRVKQGGRR